MLTMTGTYVHSEGFFIPPFETIHGVVLEMLTFSTFPLLVRSPTPPKAAAVSNAMSQSPDTSDNPESAWRVGSSGEQKAGLWLSALRDLE